MYASLLVLTHPRRRAVTALLRARQVASRARGDPEIAWSRAAQASRLRGDTRPPQVPGRVVLMSFADSRDALERVDAEAVDQLASGARERWRLVLEPVRVNGDWMGFAPEVDGVAPMGDEPVAVMISGVLKARYLRRFLRDSARIVTSDLATAAGFLGGFGFSDTPMTTTSFSCWASPRHSRAFAFANGHHPEAIRVDRAEHRHKTEFTVRFRLLHSEGTIDGRDPFAGHLPTDRS